MELALIKLLFYGFIGAIGALVIYITALAAFFYSKLTSIKNEEPFVNLAASDIERVQQEFSEDTDSDLLTLKAIRLLEKGLKVELAIKKVRLDVCASTRAAYIDRY
jgi:hypothetical protein